MPNVRRPDSDTIQDVRSMPEAVSEKIVDVSNEIDLNHDGVISDMEEDLYEKKAKNRRLMAWVSLLAMIFVGVAILFVVPESRLQKINSMLDLFWISLGGVVGAYVGISTWMSKR